MALQEIEKLQAELAETKAYYKKMIEARLRPG
jgi:hypothetical protein